MLVRAYSKFSVALNPFDYFIFPNAEAEISHTSLLPLFPQTSGKRYLPTQIPANCFPMAQLDLIHGMSPLSLTKKCKEDTECWVMSTV